MDNSADGTSKICTSCSRLLILDAFVPHGRGFTVGIPDARSVAGSGTDLILRLVGEATRRAVATVNAIARQFSSGFARSIMRSE